MTAATVPPPADIAAYQTIPEALLVTKSFVSIGVTVLDIVGQPISAIPDGESTVIINTIKLCVAGTAAAPAVIAARMGMQSTLIAAIGNDDTGDFLLSKLGREGVNTDLIQRRDDIPTAATILPINVTGARPNWHMPGAFLFLEPTDEAITAITAADYIHWGGVGLLFNFDAEKIASILGKAKSNGASITADLIGPGDHTLDAVTAIAPYLDYFMPSIDEALFLSGLDTAEDAATFFIELGAAACVIKCGARGAYLATQQGERSWVPVMDGVKVVDTSGCGDAFCAGFNVALAHGYDAVDACHFAAATAAQVAMGAGSDAGVKDFATTKNIMTAGTVEVSA